MGTQPFGLGRAGLGLPVGPKIRMADIHSILGVYGLQYLSGVQK